MPKKKLPGYLRHPATNQARTIIQGKTYYLGIYGSKESRDKYDELMREYLCYLSGGKSFLHFSVVATLHIFRQHIFYI